MSTSASTKREISCRITRTLIMYVREKNGSLGNLLDGLELDEGYLTDTNNWVSHEFLQLLYARMTQILGDKNPVYKMALASKRYESLGLLDWIVRLLGTPKLIYTQAPKYNKFLKANGDVYIHDSGDSWVVLRDEGGKAVGLLGVTRDITDRKRAERLDQAKIAAEASSAAKSAFLSNMSHELRTPLNHIMGFTELILGKKFGDLNEIQEEYLSDIYKSSEHLLSLVNQVLDVSKIEAGKLDLNKSEINLKKLLEQSLSIMDKAAARNIQLTTKIDQIPKTIIADELRMKQILYNLLSNAVKFTDDGGNICLGARMIVGPDRAASTETESLPGEVEISVIDTGIGIRKEDVEKIFEPFSQLDSSLNRKYPGTGSGLSLTRSLVEMHGGKIWVDSDGPGKGSSFRFTLPVQ